MISAIVRQGTLVGFLILPDNNANFFSASSYNLQKSSTKQNIKMIVSIIGYLFLVY
jgi:hypothetical protein